MSAPATATAFLVSGLVSHINQRADRKLDNYLELGKQLMDLHVPTILFVSADLVSALVGQATTSTFRFPYRCVGGVLDGVTHTFTCTHLAENNLFLVHFEREDLFLWPFRALGHRFAVNTGNPLKDTLEYMFVQCQKTEWMAIAAALVKHGHRSSSSSPSFPLFAWVDFGIFHMFHGNVPVFREVVLQRFLPQVERFGVDGDNAIHHRVFMASCWNPHLLVGDVYRDIHWGFAGSVFYSDVDGIEWFAGRMREKCLQILRERNTLMWEINVWLLLFHEHPHRFSIFKADHNHHIFGV